MYVPSIGLIVGGDAVYNGIHPHLSETDTQSRLEWISTLDKLEALKSKAVVAGHKVPESLCALGRFDPLERSVSGRRSGDAGSRGQDQLALDTDWT